MLQRLKGAIDSIDSRISEEQSRQRSTPGRSNSVRRSANTARNDSRPKDASALPGPDPAEFDGMLSDNSGAPSRSVTPALASAQDNETTKPQRASKEEVRPIDIAAEAATGNPGELPMEVRVKLRRLEKLDSKFQDLLRSYRVAHPKAKLVDPFEVALKENTPLTSIADPAAFVEYMNQVNVKTNLVMDELKRVTDERDSLKTKLSTGPESRSSNKQGEDFFSYDEELPRLESELKSRDAEIEKLQVEITRLNTDLAVTRESTVGMASSLEEATKELSILRERKEGGDSNQMSLSEADTLRKAESSLAEAQTELVEVKAKLAKSLTDVEEAEISTLQKQLSSAKEQEAQLRQRVIDLEETTDLLQAQKISSSDLSSTSELDSEVLKQCKFETARDIENFKNALLAEIRPSTHQTESQSAPADASSSKEAPATGAASAKKKTNKKKKKKPTTASTKEDQSSTKQSEDEPKTEVEQADPSSQLLDAITKRMNGMVGEISSLKSKIKDQNEGLEKADSLQANLAELQRKLKDQDDLKEEIESLRDDLVTVGSEHVDTKDELKTVKAQKAKLEAQIESHQRSSADAATLETLKAKISNLERDLTAEQNLAISRYKDISDLKTVLQKAQPELLSLRSELASLKSTKTDLTSKTRELTAMDTKFGQLKAEVTDLEAKLTDRDLEIKILHSKIKQESEQRTKVEEYLRTAQSSLNKSESEKNGAQESVERLNNDVKKLQDVTNVYRSKIRELEQQAAKLNREVERLQEEVDLKKAQTESAQNLINSMRGQTSEIGMQMKEVRERSESLEEELADAHRLLGERSREGEMMRRLLADMEGSADAKVREMKTQMEVAIEERDRAEDEASTIGRKRTRELETLRAKTRDAERNLRRALDEKEDLERTQAEWKRQKEELQSQNDHSSQEMTDIKQAMNQLRDALDDSEKQVQLLEQQRADLRAATSEMQNRLEKLQKSNKTLNDDLKSLQALSKTKMLEAEALSSRTSTDSASSRPNLAALNGAKGRASPKTVSEGLPAQLDFVYLKNVLLQFLEQKDKNHQKQLIPVLGMLLHFDRKDEQKWMSAIATK